jgi:hypothetical protein
VVVGHEWPLYLGYLLSNGNGGTHILEQGSCKTDSISGIFKLLRVLTGVVEYGLEGTEGREGNGFWGLFLGAVLETLAGLRGKNEGRGRAGEGASAITGLTDKAIHMAPSQNTGSYASVPFQLLDSPRRPGFPTQTEC